MNALTDLRVFGAFDLKPKIVEHAIDQATSSGAASPCAKSKRGVAVFSCNVVAAAHNAPPEPFKCDGSEACRAACGKLAVHAEERAMNAWRELGMPPDGAHVLHLKVVDGQPVPSTGPSCVTCSRSMLELRVGWVWLWTENGWQGWTATDFHRATLTALGIGSELAGPGGRP